MKKEYLWEKTKVHIDVVDLLRLLISSLHGNAQLKTDSQSGDHILKNSISVL